MKTVVIIMSIVTTIASSACSVFGIRSGTSEVPFTVVDHIGDIEIRSYESRMVAEVTKAKDSSEAFYLLFDYISGANSTDTSITMTAPVEVQTSGESIAMTAPVEVRTDTNGTVSMRFFLPKDFTHTSTPVPRDPRVAIIALEPETYAALRYSGLSGDEKFTAMSESLIKTLQNSRWKIIGEPHFYGFDPPFTIPFLRRNEVMVTVEQQGE